MTTVVVTYAVYLLISVALTAWVAHTLHKNGRIFLVDVFHGNDALADSVNHLLVVGFYLINLGYVSLALKISDPVTTAQGAIESLASKLGVVMLVLGAMHFFNLAVFNKLRNQAVLDAERTQLIGRAKIKVEQARPDAPATYGY